ncbi:MAG: VanW family protein [Lachnospiraceae bacterium]|nr:VanW family protein [Lachnospiraceae bacterium]
MGTIMKKFGSMLWVIATTILLSCITGISVQAAETAVIQKGIYVDTIDISGMTAEEAKETIAEYVASLEHTEITLRAGEGKSVSVTAADIGLIWKNQEVVEEACGYGVKGNVIQRYKAKKDLEHEKKVFNLEFDIDTAAAGALLNEKCSDFNIAAVNASLKREKEQFIIEEGQEGLEVEIQKSLQAIKEYINTDWDYQNCSIDLITKVEEPKGSAEELNKVKDVLGTFTTNYHTSGADRSANVANGCALINGATLYPGDSLSVYEMISPFTVENGYHMAGSYLNGMVVESLGGGICQVSTTLYNAVLRAELQVDERHNHSMIISYVDPSADAAIAGTSKDFKFTNSTDTPIYIEGITTPEKKITFTIYGVETRDSNRTVTYESEVLKKTVPEHEKIVADAAAPVGSINVQSVHIGYQARLWKVVTENGKEVSREEVNTSSYQAVPRTASVGIASADPAVTAAMQAAINSGSIDYVKGVIAQYKAATAVPTQAEVIAAQQAAEAAQAQAAAEAEAASTNTGTNENSDMNTEASTQ